MKVDGQRSDDTIPVMTSIAELRRAVPIGTPVIVFGDPAPSAAILEADGVTAVTGSGKGIPEGSTLVSPSVQGLLFRDESGAFARGMAPRRRLTKRFLPLPLHATSGKRRQSRRRKRPGPGE
jgi:hypothetical protein